MEQTLADRLREHHQNGKELKTIWAEKYERALTWVQDANRAMLINALLPFYKQETLRKRSTKEMRGNIRSRARVGQFDVDKPFAQP